MTSGDYSRSYKLKQALVIVPMGDSRSLNSNTGIHAHHTYKHIASTFSTILEFQTSARFRIREWLCNDDWPWSEKEKKNPPPLKKKKKKKITDQGREGFAKILFDYFFYLFFFVLFCFYSFLDNAYTCAKLRICNNHIYPRQKTKGLGDILVFV